MRHALPASGEKHVDLGAARHRGRGAGFCDAERGNAFVLMEGAGFGRQGVAPDSPDKRSERAGAGGRDGLV